MHVWTPEEEAIFNLCLKDDSIPKPPGYTDWADDLLFGLGDTFLNSSFDEPDHIMDSEPAPSGTVNPADLLSPGQGPVPAQTVNPAPGPPPSDSHSEVDQQDDDPHEDTHLQDDAHLTDHQPHRPVERRWSPEPANFINTSHVAEDLIADDWASSRANDKVMLPKLIDSIVDLAKLAMNTNAASAASRTKPPKPSRPRRSRKYKGGGSFYTPRQYPDGIGLSTRERRQSFHRGRRSSYTRDRSQSPARRTAHTHDQARERRQYNTHTTHGPRGRGHVAPSQPTAGPSQYHDNGDDDRMSVDL